MYMHGLGTCGSFKAFSSNEKFRQTSFFDKGDFLFRQGSFFSTEELFFRQRSFFSTKELFYDKVSFFFDKEGFFEKGGSPFDTGASFRQGVSFFDKTIEAFFPNRKCWKNEGLFSPPSLGSKQLDPLFKIVPPPLGKSEILDRK